MKTEPTFQQVRKIKPTRLSVSGLFPFKDGVSIPYESTLERDLLLYFTYIPAVEEIVSQPVSILFVKNGMTYPYTPDFFICFNDGRPSLLIEVKPKSKWQEHWRNWKEKWEATMAFCKKNKCIFHVYNEDRIRHLALFNINSVQSYKQQQCNLEDIEAVLTQVKLHGSTMIDFLLSHLFTDSLYHFLPSKKRTIQHNGVTIDGLRYYDVALNMYTNDSDEKK